MTTFGTGGFFVLLYATFIYMHRINWLLTLSSLNVLLVTIERFSFTTKILLQPYGFIRFHEVFQICTLILFTVLIPVYLLKEATHHWELLKTKYGTLLLALFVTGVYFYATGNGVHELASFQFNRYCDTKNVEGNLCGGFFFNDYYFGNGLYFLGAILMNLPLLVFEWMKPNATFTKKDLVPLWINSIVYAFAIFAYAAFDRVLVGLVYSVIMTGIAALFFFRRKKPVHAYPITASLMLAYALGMIASLVVRFR